MPGRRRVSTVPHRSNRWLCIGIFGAFRKRSTSCETRASLDLSTAPTPALEVRPRAWLSTTPAVRHPLPTALCPRGCFSYAWPALHVAGGSPVAGDSGGSLLVSLPDCHCRYPPRRLYLSCFLSWAIFYRLLPLISTVMDPRLRYYSISFACLLSCHHALCSLSVPFAPGDLLFAAVDAAIVVACTTLPALNLVPTLPPPPSFGRRPHAPTFFFSFSAFLLSICPDSSLLV